MPLVIGRPRRWQQRRNLLPSTSVTGPLNDKDEPSQQISSITSPALLSQGCPQSEHNFFDSSSATNVETSFDQDYDYSSDTDDESTSGEGLIDHSSSYYNLISKYEDDGPIMANRGDSAQKMIRTEEGKWTEFCNVLTIENRVQDPMADPVNPIELLKQCHAPTFKAYLDWRCKNSRIKKEASIGTYWKVLSMLYADQFATWIDGKVLFDIGNWIPVVLTPKYGLNRSSKNKSGLYIGDLDIILHHHWVFDQDVLKHERLRVQMAVALVLAGATATRPGALIQHLYYKNVEFHVFPPISGSKRARIGMTVTLTKTKRTAGISRPTTFGFHEEDTLLRDPILYIMSLAFADRAFENQFNSPVDIYDLSVPADQPRMVLPWKEEWRERPIFRDTKGLQGSTTIALDRAFSYTTARRLLLKLGRALGYEKQLEWYDLRRGSGKKLNEALTPEERNHSMGHTLGDSSTYIKFYMTDFVAVDFQNVVFGSEPQQDLIQLMGRLIRRGYAPTRLTKEQMAEINKDEQLLWLREKRIQVVNKMRKQGWSLKTAPKQGRGAELVQQHDRLFRRADALRKKLYDEYLTRAIKEFHASNDGKEIARQLLGVKPSEYLVPSDVHYKLPGRARIAKLFAEVTDARNRDERFSLRIKLVQEIAHVSQQQEGVNTTSTNKAPTRPAHTRTTRQGSATGGAQTTAASRVQDKGTRAQIPTVPNTQGSIPLLRRVDSQSTAASLRAPVQPIHGMHEGCLVSASPISPDTHQQVDAPHGIRQTDASSTGMRRSCPFCGCKPHANHKCSGHPDQLPILCPYGYETCGGIFGTFEHFLDHVRRQHPMRVTDVVYA